MFDETLLDSSPSRVPALTGKHWLISLGVGVLGFLAFYFGLPVVFVPPETRVLIAQSAIVGSILMCFAFILCYVASDAAHLGFKVWAWFALTFVLNLVGFVIYLIYSAAKTDNWRRATLPIAYIIEVIFVGAIVLAPLIYTEALPKGQLMTFLVAPPPPPPPPPPPAAAPPIRVARRVTVDDIMRAPTVIPKTITQIREDVPTAAVGVVGGVPGGVPGGSVGGVLGGVIGGVLSSAVPPPPPPTPVAPKRIRVGGQVEAAKLIFKPTPEYPPLAKMARITGVVRLEAIISRDGTIQDLKVLSGHPLLVKSAIDAVSRWRYQPTLLNGEPVEVVTEIDVHFTLE